MPRAIGIRDVDDDAYIALAKRASVAGLTVTDLLRRQVARIVARPSMEGWLARTQRRPSGIKRVDILAALDESRGSWPDAGR